MRVRFDAARGVFNPIGVIAAGTLGTVLGTIFWYLVGRLVGLDRIKALSSKHGRLLTLCPRALDEAAVWFGKNGSRAVFVGRILPAVRTLVSIVAGVFQMGFGRFVLFSTLGSLLWNVALTGAGYVLQSRYVLIAAYLNSAATLLVAGIVVYYLYRVVTWKPA
jgi:membrane protein DedA with SNARE-associated domain